MSIISKHASVDIWFLCNPSQTASSASQLMQVCSVLFNLHYTFVSLYMCECNFLVSVVHLLVTQSYESAASSPSSTVWIVSCSPQKSAVFPDVTLRTPLSENIVNSISNLDQKFWLPLKTLDCNYLLYISCIYIQICIHTLVLFTCSIYSVHQNCQWLLKLGCMQLCQIINKLII